MALIKAPVEAFNGAVGGVQFANGEATTDNKAVIAYCKAAGYTISKGPDTQSKTPAAPVAPSGNASTEEWTTYAIAQGKTPEELDGKSRDEIRDLFTSK